MYVHPFPSTIFSLLKSWTCSLAFNSGNSPFRKLQGEIHLEIKIFIYSFIAHYLKTVAVTVVSVNNDNEWFWLAFPIKEKETSEFVTMFRSKERNVLQPPTFTDSLKLGEIRDQRICFGKIAIAEMCVCRLMCTYVSFWNGTVRKSYADPRDVRRAFLLHNPQHS